MMLLISIMIWSTFTLIIFASCFTVEAGVGSVSGFPIQFRKCQWSYKSKWSSPNKAILNILVKVTLFYQMTLLDCHWTDLCFGCRDGIHFSSEGSKIVVKEILKVLREAEWEPSLHWRSLPTEFDEDSSYYPVAPDGKSTVNVSNTKIYVQWE